MEHYDDRCMNIKWNWYINNSICVYVRNYIVRQLMMIVLLCYVDESMYEIHYVHVYIYVRWHTVCIQIFEACKFQGCHKSSIFAILFSRITKYPALVFMQVKVRQWNFEDENFADGQWKPRKLHPSKICTYTVVIWHLLRNLKQLYIMLHESLLSCARVFIFHFYSTQKGQYPFYCINN